MRVSTYTFRHMQKPIGILGLPQRFFVTSVAASMLCFPIADALQSPKYGLISAVVVCALSWGVCRRLISKDHHADRVLVATWKWKARALFSKNKNAWSYAAGRRFQS